MSLATLIMAGAILAGLLCTLVLGLVATTLAVLTILALRRVRPQPPRRQPSRAVRPSPPEMQTSPGSRCTTDASFDPPADRLNRDIYDGFTRLYTTGLLH